MDFLSALCRLPSRAHQVQESIERYVAEINADPSILPSRGDFSKYVLEGDDRKGSLELTWVTKGEDGIACNLESEGADALNAATAAVRPLFACAIRPLSVVYAVSHVTIETCMTDYTAVAPK